MKRHYYVSDNLDDLEAIEKELKHGGVTKPQIHILSQDDVGVEQRRLNFVSSFMKSDVVHSATVAACFGVFCAVVVLFAAKYSGITQTLGWLPFVFLAVALMGFITWEGGMWGIQKPNTNFKTFQKLLAAGQHVLYVEMGREQESILNTVIQKYPKLLHARTENSSNKLLISAENNVADFIKWAP